MAYFDCAYFDQTYFSTDCAPVVTSGRSSQKARRRLPLPPDPALIEDEELLWIT